MLKKQQGSAAAGFVAARCMLPIIVVAVFAASTAILTAAFAAATQHGVC